MLKPLKIAIVHPISSLALDDGIDSQSKLKIGLQSGNYDRINRGNKLYMWSDTKPPCIYN